MNNYVSGSAIINGQHSVMATDCLFERNSGGVYSGGDAIVINSTFMSNEVLYESGSYVHTIYYRNYRGGHAITGRQDINVKNCTFSFYSRDINIYTSYYRSNRVYITNSNFSHSNRTVYTAGCADVTITNSTFYNITYSGNGAAVYNSETVTINNCNFADIKAVNGRGAAAYGL